VSVGETAINVMRKARAGVPYEASINFGGDGIVVEDVPEGGQAEVNGYTLEGPATIFRQWPLRGVAVCPYGADMHTESQLSGQPEVSVTVIARKESQMADEMPGETPEVVDPEAPETEDPETEVVDGDPQEAPAEEPEPAAAASAAPTSEAIMAAAKPYIERFGAELGPKWFAEGQTLAEATDAYIAHLSAEVESRDKALAERDGQVADLTAKLDAARKQLGDEPVGTGDPPSTEPELDGRAAELKAKGEELLEKGQITAAEAALMGVFNREG